MADFEVGNHRYKSSRMNAMTQFHVARRLSPVFASLGEAYKKNPNDFTSALPALMGVVSGMPDADVDYIFKSCLRLCQRFQGDALPWANVTTPSGDLMFQDLGMTEMLQITYNVIADNFASFFSALPATSTGGQAAKE